VLAGPFGGDVRAAAKTERLNKEGAEAAKLNEQATRAGALRNDLMAKGTGAADVLPAAREQGGHGRRR
jgi:hypothetical protein